MPWNFSQQSLINWLYYLLSTSAENTPEPSHLAGILRGQESFSEAVSFDLNTRDGAGGRVTPAVNTILLGLAVLQTCLKLSNHVPVEVGPEDPHKTHEANSKTSTKHEDVAITRTERSPLIIL